MEECCYLTLNKARKFTRSFCQPSFEKHIFWEEMWISLLDEIWSADTLGWWNHRLIPLFDNFSNNFGFSELPELEFELIVFYPTKFSINNWTQLVESPEVIFTSFIFGLSVKVHHLLPSFFKWSIFHGSFREKLVDIIKCSMASSTIEKVDSHQAVLISEEFDRFFSSKTLWKDRSFFHFM